MRLVERVSSGEEGADAAAFLLEPRSMVAGGIE